ncbi:FYN-binding protein 1-like [Lethenteron reissneri]|uniref:FYN-binding protein 1-like n=1 Tax=Lethenteron reissneri TaxID=7753 RepID=UPI002AB79F2F|nr:FYN-binding protein 1-like [Lethenteron reissneri]
MDESEAAKLIKVQRPELKKWIGRDPTYLLDYLESRGLILRDKYHEAKDINVKVERADFLINEFIGRDECLKLWRALEGLQDHYPQLKEWISACASTTHHACDGKPGHSNQPDSIALDQDEQQITQIDSKQNTRVPVTTAHPPPTTNPPPTNPPATTTTTNHEPTHPPLPPPNDEPPQVHEMPRSNDVVSDYLHMDSSISEASENHGRNVEAKENHSREREKLRDSEPPKKPTPRPRRGRW